MTFYTTAENSLEIKKKPTPVSELVHARMMNTLSESLLLFSTQPDPNAERIPQ
jgi:hypothetical protein